MVGNPIPSDLASECRKCSKIINQFIKPDKGMGPDQMIPPNIIAKAKGIAIMSVLKAGFLFSARAGSGLVVARLDDGSWSAPSAIGTGGIGAGGQIGAELTDFVFILNTKDAVKAFSHGGNLTFGGNVSVAVGPLGRNAEASGSVGNLAAIFSYSKTRGLFAGVSLEGTVLLERKDANAAFYHRKISAKELLTGVVPPPPVAEELYRALNRRVTGVVMTYGANSEYGGSQYGGSQYGGSQYAPSEAGRRSNDFPRPAAANSYVAGAAATGAYANGVTKAAPPFSAASPAAPPAPGPAPGPAVGGFGGSQRGYGAAAAAAASARQSRPPPPPPPNRMGGAPADRAVALYDYVAERASDLSFSAGDEIIITKRTASTNDWWEGRCRGASGAFPANYVSTKS